MTDPVTLQLLGVTAADWESGGQQVFNEAVAEVALGDASLSVYVYSMLVADDVSLFGAPTRKLLQAVGSVRPCC